MKKLLIFLLFIFTQIAFSQDDDDIEGEIGLWHIKNGIFIDNDNRYNDLAKAYWNVFYNLFPKKVTQKYIKQIVLFTDGKDEKTGAVVPLNSNNKEWQLMLDVADVDFKSIDKDRFEQSIYTVIHEFGHLLTLNNTQIYPSDKRIQKKGEPYITEEGQCYDDSYLNQFVNLYWSGGMLKSWERIRKKYCKVEQEDCVKKLYSFYGDNYTHFLTDYAATCPEEDIVESWTEFVIRQGKFKRPVYINQRKVNFFYRFPKLIKYRKIIKKNLKKIKEKL